jgi:hypothetical protein
MNLTLLHYTNYKNRVIKAPLPTPEDYVYEYGATILLQQPDTVLWDPNDGITTKQIIETYSGKVPDYLIVSDDYGNIDSRWYVMEM